MKKKTLFSILGAFALAGVLMAASSPIISISWNALSNTIDMMTSDGQAVKALSARGVTDGSSACTGCVGESIIVTGTGPAWGGSGSATNIATYTLQPGEWDVSGFVYSDLATGTWYQQRGSISTTSATHEQTYMAITPWGSFNTVTACAFVTPTRRFKVAAGSTTPIYLVASVYTAPATGTWQPISKLIISRVR